MDGLPSPEKMAKEIVIRQSIEASGIYLGWWTELFVKDEDCLRDLAQAIALNKHIYLLVQDGIGVPDQIMKFVDEYVTFKKNRGNLAQRHVELIMKGIKNGHLAKSALQDLDTDTVFAAEIRERKMPKSSAINDGE